MTALTSSFQRCLPQPATATHRRDLPPANLVPLQLHIHQRVVHPGRRGQGSGAGGANVVAGQRKCRNLGRFLIGKMGVLKGKLANFDGLEWGKWGFYI
jgi:hypothetical protein